MFSITNKCKCISCSSSCAGLCDSWPSGWCSCCGTWQGAPAKKYGHLMKSLHSGHAGRFGWFWSGLATFRLQRFEHSSLHQAQPHLQRRAVCDPNISNSAKQHAEKIKLTLDKIELVTSQSFGVYTNLINICWWFLLQPAASIHTLRFSFPVSLVCSPQVKQHTAHLYRSFQLHRWHHLLPLSVWSIETHCLSWLTSSFLAYVRNMSSILHMAVWSLLLVT